MLATTQVFMLGTLPIVGIAVLKVLANPGSPEGYGMLIGVTALIPLLVFWTFTAMDFNLRKNDGRGSSYLYDAARRWRLLAGCFHPSL